MSTESSSGTTSFSDTLRTLFCRPKKPQQPTIEVDMSASAQRHASLKASARTDSYVLGGQTCSLLTFMPLRQPHKQTFLILHGSGDAGASFGPMLLMTHLVRPSGADAGSPPPVPPSSPPTDIETLRDAYPHAKFIFPTAAKRLSSRHEQVITRWFEWWGMKDMSERMDVQAAGLRESTDALLRILREECEAVGNGNVVLAGLSNGSAQSMAMLVLLARRLKLGAFAGMCGWMPYSPEFEKREGSLEEVSGWFAKEIGWEGEDTEDGIEKTETLTPVFLGHGAYDMTIPLDRMSEANAILTKLGFAVEKKMYPTLGHWYSPEMLGDIVTFLGKHVPPQVEA